jgi:plasmid stabilization system protein ParE
MPSIVITPATENDLIKIRLYSARDNPDAADRVYQSAETTFKALAARPRIGTNYQPR